MMKKLLTLLCATVMLMTVTLPTYAGESLCDDTPDDVFTFNGLEYEVRNGEATVTGYSKKPEGKLTIPETVLGYPVTEIGEGAFYYCDSFTSVEMPQVKTVAGAAFRLCNSLESVDMPKVTSIGEGAFYECESLSSAYFYSDAPTKFGEAVFYNYADDFSIYYAAGTDGWTTPEWNGYPCQSFIKPAVTGSYSIMDSINKACIKAVVYVIVCCAFK